MMNTISEKVDSLGHELPAPARAVGSYVPSLLVHNVLYISGQLPIQQGEVVYSGRVFPTSERRHSGNDRRKKGREGEQQSRSDRRSTLPSTSIDQAVLAAQLCALNIIGHIKEATGDDFDRVEQIVRLGGFVLCDPAFTSHPRVINGASDLMVEVFGQQVGKHVRVATGASSLPLMAAVEIEATVLLKC